MDRFCPKRAWVRPVLSVAAAAGYAHVTEYSGAPASDFRHGTAVHP